MGHEQLDDGIVDTLVLVYWTRDGCNDVKRGFPIGSSPAEWIAESTNASSGDSTLTKREIATTKLSVNPKLVSGHLCVG